ncbi:MAG: cytochrome c oxidase subunit 3 [Singulisphaera sp.]
MNEAVAELDPDPDPVPLAHHFDDPEQQHDSALLGMWAFLATEVMFFGGLLAAYTVYRISYPDEFAAASHHGLDLWIGGANTFVLLGSSLAVALAVHASQHRRRQATVGYLLGRSCWAPPSWGSRRTNGRSTSTRGSYPAPASPSRGTAAASTSARSSSSSSSTSS